MVVNLPYTECFRSKAPNGIVHFVMWGHKDNFNDASVICRSVEWAKAGIWEHSELHFTSMTTLYAANAAATMFIPYLTAGQSGGGTAVSYPVGCSEVTAAAKILRACSGPIDIACDPRLDGQAADFFAQIQTVNHNAADDISVFFVGWYSDIPPSDRQLSAPPDPIHVIIDEVADDVFAWPLMK